jgi:ABC-type nitrate/sulfonate/bicarbonate transport system permease component
MEATAQPRTWQRRLLDVVAAVIVAVVCWSVLAALVRHYRGAPFPGPLEALSRLAQLVGGRELLRHSLYTHVLATVARWGTGFAAGALAGVLLAAWIGWSRRAEALLLPFLYVLQLIPGLAWIPIALLLFGVGDRATVFMILVTALAPVAINMVAGIKGVSEEHLRVARMAGARSADIFRHVLLPGSVPHLMSGLRVGLGTSWRVVVAAEMVVGKGTGLGYSIIQCRWNLDYASAFVCVFLIALIGLAVEYGAFSRLEAMTTRRWGMVRA